MIPTTHIMTRLDGRYFQIPTGAGAGVGSGSMGSVCLSGVDMAFVRGWERTKGERRISGVGLAGRGEGAREVKRE